MGHHSYTDAEPNPSKLSKLRRLIFGAGSHGKVVLDTCLCAGWRPDVLLDDHPLFTKINKVPVWQFSEALRDLPPKFEFVIAVGNNSIRHEIAKNLQALGGSPVTIIHPFSFVSSTADIGAGSVVFAGAVVQSGCRLGEHVIINTGTSVDHDCHVGDFVHLCPGVRLAGNVSIGTGTMLGVGTAVIPGLEIGSWTTVGAGSVVVRSLPGGVTAFGNPARPKMQSDRVHS